MRTEGPGDCGLLLFVSEIVGEPVTTVLVLAEASLTDMPDRTERRAVAFEFFG
jgi:hypothetical protein